jgi:hypothetical protein
VNREQVFKAPVSQVAGQDVTNNVSHNINTTIKHETTVMQFPERRPESQLQAEFAARTGIWCPKDAREWLESLLEHEGFTVRDLSMAWSAKSVGWNAKTGERSINTPWIEAVGGWFLVTLVTVLLLSVSLSWVLAPSPRTFAADLAVFGAGAVYLVMVWLVCRSMLWPRRTAMRIRRVERAK